MLTASQTKVVAASMDISGYNDNSPVFPYHHMPRNAAASWTMHGLATFSPVETGFRPRKSKVADFRRQDLFQKCGLQTQ